MGSISHVTIGGTAPPRGAPVKFVFGLRREVKGVYYLVVFISEPILSSSINDDWLQLPTCAQRRPGRRTRSPMTKATTKVQAVVTAWIERQRG